MAVDNTCCLNGLKVNATFFHIDIVWHPDHFGTQKRIILEHGPFWNTEEKKTLRDCSLTPVSRIILEHTSFGSASKASFVS